MVQFIVVTADEVATRHLEEAAVAAMAFDLNEAAVDLDASDHCARALLDRRHPTGLVTRLVDRSIAEARLLRTAKANNRSITG